MRRTPLYDRHRAEGAKLVDFAGWEMPVCYPPGIRAEHISVRHGCGVFDVSHMGRVLARGPGAARLLQRATSNDVEALEVGGAQYGLMCRQDGGVLEDLFTYRLAEEEYMVVTNASNHERDLRELEALAEPSGAAAAGVEIEDRREPLAMLAVQGPASDEVMEQLSDEELPERHKVRPMTIAGVDALACGTGYTGEEGVELILAARDAETVWDRLIEVHVVPCGLGCRDTLRLEACFHLYGNDLSEDRNPIEAGLGWACKDETGYRGSEAVAAVRAAGPAQKLVPFEIDGPGIARQGNEIEGGGVVTSGTLSPTLERGIGMAYVPAAMSHLGTRLRIDVRGRTREAVVVERPFAPKRL